MTSCTIEVYRKITIMMKLTAVEENRISQLVKPQSHDQDGSVIGGTHKSSNVDQETN